MKKILLILFSLVLLAGCSGEGTSSNAHEEDYSVIRIEGEMYDIEETDDRVAFSVGMTVEEINDTRSRLGVEVFPVEAISYVDEDFIEKTTGVAGQPTGEPVGAHISKGEEGSGVTVEIVGGSPMNPNGIREESINAGIEDVKIRVFATPDTTLEDALLCVQKAYEEL